MIRRWILGSVTVVSFLTAFGMACYVAWHYWMDYQLAQQFYLSAEAAPSQEVKRVHQQAKAEEKPAKPIPHVWKEQPKVREKVGTLDIPSISAHIPIFQGVGDEQLAKGAGNHLSTALPGEPDTVAIGGHRETAFKKIEDIRVGASIVVRTKEGKAFFYLVTKTWITDAGDREVVRRTGKPVLRLYSCYTSSTDLRYVVEAELIK
jgi:LPXTG-site transpeptidase (sortase) family protein